MGEIPSDPGYKATGILELSLRGTIRYYVKGGLFSKAGPCREILNGDYVRYQMAEAK